MKRQKSSRASLLFEGISQISMIIFHIGAPLIFLYLCAFLILLLSTPDTPGYVLAMIHKDTLEHIVMSATIITVGGFFFDILQKSTPQKE